MNEWMNGCVVVVECCGEIIGVHNSELDDCIVLQTSLIEWLLHCIVSSIVVIAPHYSTKKVATAATSKARKWKSQLIASKKSARFNCNSLLSPLLASQNNCLCPYITHLPHQLIHKQPKFSFWRRKAILVEWDSSYHSTQLLTSGDSNRSLC